MRMSNIDVAIMRLPHGAGLELPKPATQFSAGSDLLAAVSEPLTLAPGEYKIVPSGIAIALPAGYEAQVRPRSGLAAKHGVTVLNSPGTIDGDYRGEIGVILINHSDQPFIIERGMRIAQLVLAPVVLPTWQETESLDITVRGAGGFGSTGTGNQR